jgi:hypothetical protein
LGVTSDARKLLRLPVENGGLVPLAGTALRFLRRPSQPPPQEAPDMVVVVADAEVPKDDLANASGGPECIRPAVCLGALEQESFEALELDFGKSWIGIGMRLGGQSIVVLVSQLAPAINRGAVDSEEAGHSGRLFALADKLDGAPPPAFEFCRRTKGSTHTTLDAPIVKRMH